MRDQKELHPAYIKKLHREHGSPSTMPVEPLHRVNRSIHKLKKSFLTIVGHEYPPLLPVRHPV